MIAAWEKWWPCIAPAGHAATHVPQPAHRAPLTIATFRSVSISIALYGQTGTQVRQPEHRAVSTNAVTASVSSFLPPTTAARAFPQAAAPWVIAPCMLIGDWQVPAI